MRSERKARADPRRLDAVLGVVAAAGSLASAMTVCAVLAAVLPLSAPARVALALHTLVPLWVAATCVTVTAANACRALVVHGAVIAVCAALLAGDPAHRALSTDPSPLSTVAP